MAFRIIKTPSFGVYVPKAHMPRITAKFRVRITNRGHRVVNYVEKWENQFLRRAGAAIRTYVVRGFKVVPNKQVHSPAGSMPYLHQSKAAFIKKAVMYKVNYQLRRVIVGTAYSVARLWGWKHEHGKRYGRSKWSGNQAARTQYPKRAFMKPQFDRWWKIGRPAIMYSIRKQMKSSI